MEGFEFQSEVNSWCYEPCRRTKVLVDGANYFAAFVEVAEKAQNSILILGWDIDSRAQLLRGQGERSKNYQFGPFIEDLAKQRPDLQIFILTWDYALIYAFEREILPSFRLNSITHENVHFHVDDRHPIGASHHQKVVVVDEQIAFVGGLDLCARRWDTSDHSAQNALRVDPWGQTYAPFHDIQVMLEGRGAQCLSALFWRRWETAVGHGADFYGLKGQSENSLWPEKTGADFANIQVALSRTFPAFAGRRGIFEIRRLYIDTIQRAERYIFIENQYFTSRLIVDLLGEALQKEEGPEVLMVLPRRASGWLEESTMGTLRTRALKQLQDRDRYHRLRVYYPEIPDLGGDYLRLHSKVMIIDDEFLRIGSSNLSNRSMGLDTECDVAWMADGREDIREGVRRILCRLLAEHLGVSVEELSKSLAQENSLLAVVESLRRPEGRTLMDLLESESLKEPEEVVLEQEFIDPEKPLRMSRSLQESFKRFGVLGGPISMLFLGLLLLAGLWQWSPLNEWLGRDQVVGWLEALEGGGWDVLLTVLAYVIGSLLMIPITLMIFLTVLAYDTWLATGICLLGSLLGSLGPYVIGSWVGPKALAEIPSRWLRKGTRYFKHSGLLTVVVVRMLPVAPFGVVNFVAGAVKVPLRYFVPGTLFGFLPLILTLALVGGRVKVALRDPSWLNLSVLVVVSLLALLLLMGIKRRLSEHYA